MRAGAVLGAVLAVAATLGVARAQGQRMLVLGFDGMDPNILEKRMARGEMPNFAALAARGEYTRLQTVTPPQSPVAWATVVTGMGPGGTGIFDFIHRDPVRMIPVFSATRTTDPERTIKIGSCILPLDSGEVINLRDGIAFWQILDEQGIPATVLKIPSNYPPVETGARTLSGMGTPDVKGTYGTFQEYTDDPALPPGSVPGGEIHRVELRDGRFDATLTGPVNTMREGSPLTEIPFTVHVDGSRDVVRIDIGDEKILLGEGEWSHWVEVKFSLCWPIASISGIVRFHLAGTHPRVRLYASPVNLAPDAPAQPISTPVDLAAEIAGAIGPFYTQGMPEDTQALSAGAISDDGFMAQARIILAEEDRMLDWALDGFDDGFLFVYYGVVDMVSHMMWRAMDRNHPMWSPDLQRRHGDAIGEMYRGADAALGRALSRVGNDTTVLVISDHGFAPFYREVNLNTWLKDQGYLVLTDDALESRTEFFNHVDWGRTRAFAVGFNSLYLNRRGRERWGIVDPGPEAKELLDEIAGKLLTFRDHSTGLTVVSRAYATSEIFEGAHRSEAPDLIVGYRRGYRASDKSALGSLSRPVVQDRLDAWSGDHLMETGAVPGILLSNRKLVSGRKNLEDIAPTILVSFGIPPPPEMTGRPLLREE